MTKILHQESVKLSSVLKLRQYHDYLTDIVNEVDDIFSPAVFFWYSTFIISVCIDITFDVTHYSNLTDYPLLMSIFKLAVHFGAYASVGISASFAIEESQKCIPILFRLTSVEGPLSNIHLSQALQMMTLHLKSSELALTVWKLFKLNRSYIMTIIGVIVSYFIIIVQLNPSFITNMISDWNSNKIIAFLFLYNRMNSFTATFYGAYMVKTIKTYICSKYKKEGWIINNNNRFLYFNIVQVHFSSNLFNWYFCINYISHKAHWFFFSFWVRLPL